MSNFNIIPPQVPLVGQDGRIAREWYLFLLNLFQTNGSGNNAITQDQFEALVVAASRPPRSVDLEQALRDVAVQLQAQRSERSAIDELRRRVVDLEAQIQTMRQPPADQRVADLQTITFGSR